MTLGRDSGLYDAYGKRTSPFDTEPPPPSHPTPPCGVLPCPECLGHRQRITLSGTWVDCDTCNGTGGVTGRQLMEWHERQEQCQ